MVCKLKCSYLSKTTAAIIQLKTTEVNDTNIRMRDKAKRDGRPAVKWMKTFTRDMEKVRMWYLIQANAIQTAVQARDNPWVTSAIH